MPRVLVIGATGYVGSAVAKAFVKAGWEVTGLLRREAAARPLRALGVTPLLLQGGFAEMADLATEFPVVILAAKLLFPEETQMVRAFVGKRGWGGTLIFTSGTGVISIAAPEGLWNENSFAEDDLFAFPPLSVRKARLPIENLVRSAAPDMRSMVIRLPLVWGLGGSDHIPRLFKCASDFGAVYVLGAGLNVISNVHVDDVAALYVLAAERGVAGALYHAVAGEADFRSLARAVASVAHCRTDHLSYEEMVAAHGKEWVNLGLAVNSRSKAQRARQDLGWSPQHFDVIGDILEGSYAQGI